MESYQEEINVLFHAANLGRADIVGKAIASLRSKIDSENKDGRDIEDLQHDIAAIISCPRPDDQLTPLHVAAMQNKSDVVRTLLQAGASLSCSPSSGPFANKKPFDVATDSVQKTFHVYLFEQIAMGDLSNTGRLLDGGVDPNMEDGSRTKDSMLHWASSFGNADIVRELVAHGSKVNYQNSEGFTPLHIAARNGHTAVVKELLEAGADPTILDFTQQSAFCMAKSDECRQQLQEASTFGLQTETRGNESENIASVDISANESAIDSNVTMEVNNSLPEDMNVTSEETIEGNGNGETQPSQSMRSCHWLSDDIDMLLSQLDSVNSKNSSTPSISNAQGRSDIGSAFVEDSIELLYWPQPKIVSRSAIRSSQRFLRLYPRILVHLASDLLQQVTAYSTWSQLSETLESFNLGLEFLTEDVESESQESVVVAPHTALTITVDDRVCTSRNSYRLVVHSGHMEIVASDSVGVFYAMQTLAQHLRCYHRLESLTGDPLDQEDGDGSQIENENHANESVVTVPVVQIEDSADVSLRGVMWSLTGRQLRLTPLAMKQCVEVLAKARINSLFLAVDAKNEHDNDNSSDTASTSSLAARVFSLDEMCSQHGIDLMPSVTLSRVGDILPHSLLSSFTSDALTIQLLMTKDSVVTADSLAQYLRQVFVEISKLGYTTVFVQSTSVIDHLVDLQALSQSVSEEASRITRKRCVLTLVPQSLSEALDLRLFGGRAVTSIRNDLRAVSAAVGSAIARGGKMIVFPFLTEYNYLLNTKFACFLFGGFSWNYHKSFDTLQKLSMQCETRDILVDIYFHGSFRDLDSDQDTNLSIVSDGRSTDYNSSNQNTTTENHNIMFRIISEVLFPFNYGNNFIERESENDGSFLSMARMKSVSIVENFLYILVNDSKSHSLIAMPEREHFVNALKVYKKILGAVKWKIRILTTNNSFNFSSFLTFFNGNTSNFEIRDEFAFSIEVEEFLSTVFLYKILCKAIIAGYQSKDKVVSKLPDMKDKIPNTFTSLIRLVPLGIKSDFANSCLEVIEHFSFIWKRKFDVILIPKQTFEMSNIANNGSVIEDDNEEILLYRELMNLHKYLSESSVDSSCKSDESGHESVEFDAVNHYILLHNKSKLKNSEIDSVSIVTIFKLLTENIIMPKSVKDVFEHLMVEK